MFFTEDRKSLVFDTEVTALSVGIRNYLSAREVSSDDGGQPTQIGPWLGTNSMALTIHLITRSE